MDWTLTVQILSWLTSLVLASAVPIVLVIGHYNRMGNKGDKAKGLGWQFIRYTVLSIALPIVGVLALNNALTGEAATLIAGAMGYAFGNKSEDTKPKKDDDAKRP